jgi:hypothetical protein
MERFIAVGNGMAGVACADADTTANALPTRGAFILERNEAASAPPLGQQRPLRG